MLNTNESFHKFIANKVTIDLYVFSLFMKKGILGNVDSSKIVTFHMNRHDGRNGNFM